MPAAERVAVSEREREIFSPIDQTHQMLIFQCALNCILIVTSTSVNFQLGGHLFFQIIFQFFVNSFLINEVMIKLRTPSDSARNCLSASCVN